MNGVIASSDVGNVELVLRRVGGQGWRRCRPERVGIGTRAQSVEKVSDRQHPSEPGFRAICRFHLEVINPKLCGDADAVYAHLHLPTAH